MTGPLQNPAGATPGTRHDPLERWAFAYDRFFHDQSVRFEIGIVLGISDRALQRLVNEERRLLGRESEQIECCRDRQTLDLTRDFARLKRRNPRILICRSHFHLSYLKLTSGRASTWRRSPTFIFPFFESIS